MKKKKLLIATDSFLPRWDGIARFLSELVPEIKDDYDITILAPDFKGAQSNIEGIKIIRIPTYNFKVGDYPPAKIKPKTIKNIIKNTDIVFSQTIGPIGALSIYYAQKLEKPIFSYIHSIEWELVAKSIHHYKILELITYYIMKRFVRYIYNKCDLILTPSLEVAQILEFEKIKRPKTVVHLGVNIEEFKPPINKYASKEKLGLNPSHKVIGFCGRIAREKDLLTLFRAFTRLEKKYKNLTLLIVGDGIEEQKKIFKEKRNVVLTGSVNNTDDYYKAMDIYVLPSLTETTSLTTMEAMATGLAVMSTKVGYVKYYLKDKINGLIFPKHNSLVLSMKIEQLIKSPETIRQLGEEARRTIENNYAWRNTVAKIRRTLRDFA